MTDYDFLLDRTEFAKLEEYLLPRVNLEIIHTPRKTVRINGEKYIVVPEHHQLIIYDAEGNRLWDAVLSEYSYGGDWGLLEVKGTIADGDVEGWLDADDIIGRLS